MHEDATVKDSVLGPVSLSGIPVTGLDPAIGTGLSDGYLVNSFPFTASGANNPVADSVGVWSLRNAASVTTGHGTPVLTGRATPSEPYAFPVPARSTGDGGPRRSMGSVITSEKYLNPDDSRMSAPVTVSRSPGGGVQLWTALDAAVSAKGHGHRRGGLVPDRPGTRPGHRPGVRGRQGREPAVPGHPAAADRACRDGLHHHQCPHQPERGLHHAGLEQDHHGGGAGLART